MTKTNDTPVKQLEIWEGTLEQVKKAMDKGLIGDEALAIANDVTFLDMDNLGEGTLTIKKNGEKVAEFNANDKNDVEVDLSVEEQKQSDWNQTDADSKDFIKNKPTVTTITVKRF